MREDQPTTPNTEQQPARPLKERLYRTDGIILSRTSLGEADRILTIFTQHHGKIRVIAKGARRPSSRLGPHLEYFCRSRLMLAKGRDLDVVTAAETLDHHLALRTDLTAFGHASHIAELLLRLTEDRQEHELVYDLLVGSLRLLSEGVDAFAVTRHFELTLLAALGYRPELYSCVACGNPLEAAAHPFSAARGGFTCLACGQREQHGPAVSVNAQKYLRTLDRHGLAAAARLQIPVELAMELERFATGYFQYLAERDLQSLRVWHAMEPAREARSRQS